MATAPNVVGPPRVSVVPVPYAKDGRPTNISIDREANAIDDEEAYTVPVD